MSETESEKGWVAVVGEGDEAQEYAVQWLSAESRLDGVAWLDFGYAGLSPEMKLGAPVSLRHGNSEKIKLVIAGGDANQRCIRAARADQLTHSPDNSQQDRLVLFQRTEGESIWDVLHSVASDKLLASEIHETDIDIEKLNEACPVGWCMIVPERLPQPAKIIHALKNVALASDRLIAGFVRTIAQIEGRAAGLYVDDASISAKRCLELSDKWYVAPNSLTSSNERRTRIRRDIRVEYPTSYAQQLIDPGIRVLSGEEIDDDDPIPVAPVSVKTGEWQWFAESVATRIEFDAGRESDPNLAVTLDLVESSTWVPYMGTGGGVILVGEIKEAGDDSHMIGIVEPTEKEFGRLAEWKLGNVDMFLVYEAAPGFVRDERSAFIARWKTGDCVLFCVDAQGSAVILGALGKPQTEKDGDPNIQLMGDLLRISVTEKVEVERE